MEFQIGTGKKDLTCFIPGVGMMGYGQDHNRVKEIATPLWARALFIQDDDKNIFLLVHLEQAFVTLAIKEEVLKRLEQTHAEWEIKDHNLAITAQHTHSAPGGYSHYPLYNLMVPHFQTEVFEKIVSSILDAINEASKNLKAATIQWGEHLIHEDVDVAFNRSMKAHARNGEAKYFTEEEKRLAVDRKMEGLEIRATSGELMAHINWFGVHGTSISSYNQRIHHDNKGVAADLYEKKNPGACAFFLQASAGDVSPNFVWDKQTKLMRGKFKDQYENAAFNGELQFQESLKISLHKDISGKIESRHIFMDMGKVVAPPAHGVAFFQGTLEGPGISPFLGSIARLVSRTVKKVRLIKDREAHEAFYRAHGSKDVLLDHRNGSFVGIPLKTWKILPVIPEPAVKFFTQTAKNNALDTLPWVPSLLPFQILRIGHELIAFCPGEISVMAGRRLKNHLLEILKPIGVTHVNMTSYANAYMGYIVTPEEYDQQSYEGGHTVYGRDTLIGIIRGFDYLARELRGEKILESFPKEPFHFPVAELQRRST